MLALLLRAYIIQHLTPADIADRSRSAPNILNIAIDPEGIL